MSTFYVKNAQIIENKINIEGSDYNHIKNVLRLKTGEKIDICDESQVRYNVEIESFSDKNVICKIESVDEKTTESPINITLFQGLPKGDKLDLIIQKTTEMGVNTIIPVQMSRSIAKIDDKNQEKKLERWNKISLEASKQCGRQRVPSIEKAINFKNIIENISKYDIVLLPYENEKTVTIKKALKSIGDSGKSFKNIAVIIGPEGGFSEEEIKTILMLENVHIVSLGPRILRTETAGIATLAMIMYELEL